MFQTKRIPVVLLGFISIQNSCQVKIQYELFYLGWHAPGLKSLGWKKVAKQLGRARKESF